MGMPAAIMNSFHMCPQVNPGVVPVPHVGGPVIATTATVLIGGLPAAVLGDTCICSGPPDKIIKGSAGVMFGGMPAARMLDNTAHGGMIMIGVPTVLIGEAGGGGGGGAGGAMSRIMNKSKQQGKKGLDEVNKKSLLEAAKNKDGLAPKSNQDDLKAMFTLVDEAHKGMSNVDYRIETHDGKIVTGTTDSSGQTSPLSGYLPGDCRVTFLKES